MIDLFCSNGSTWYNKKYFIDECIRNDIRKGKYLVGSKNHNQIIDINPHFQMDVLNELVPDNVITDEIVYLDPPHLMNVNSGIMFQKYTSLKSEKQIEILAENCNKISDRFLIIKWNDLHLNIESFLKYFRKYFIDTIRFGDRKNKSTSWLILMIKKGEQLRKANN